MIRIFGTMTDPSGSPVPGAIIELRAISSTNEVLLGSTVNHKCDQQGAYSFQLAAGMYDAYAQNDRCGDMDYLGTAKVSANSVDGDLHSILVDGGINITPPMLESALAAAQRAESASALTAADRVSTGKDAESAKADSAAATQKAASAATHDASAQDAAARAENAAALAENAASAVVGAVLDGGECDLSTGVYPLPITVAGKKYSTIWYVAVAGSVSGVAFDVGDLLRYTTAKTGYYFKVDAKDDVYSVNNEKGAVVITPEKIGAEKTGVAQQLVTQHASKPGAHSIAGVDGLQGALDAKLNDNTVSSFGKSLIDDTDAAAARTTLGLGNSATKDSGTSIGNVVTIGTLGFGGVSVPLPGGNHNSAKQSGTYYYTSAESEINGPMLYGAGNVYAQTWGGDNNWRSEIAVSVSINRMFFRSIRTDQTNVTPWVEVRHSGNTTIDGNGFIKNASPIVRVGATELREDGDSICGDGVANFEAQGVHVEKTGIGVYKVKGSFGFAKDGWYIETPNDANGNKLRFVEYDYRNGIIEIRTFEPNYSNGRCEAGNPADIPDGRWIDVRLDMPNVVSVTSDDILA